MLASTLYAHSMAKNGGKWTTSIQLRIWFRPPDPNGRSAKSPDNGSKKLLNLCWISRSRGQSRSLNGRPGLHRPRRLLEIAYPTEEGSSESSALPPPGSVAVAHPLPRCALHLWRFHSAFRQSIPRNRLVIHVEELRAHLVLAPQHGFAVVAQALAELARQQAVDGHAGGAILSLIHI